MLDIPKIQAAIEAFSLELTEDRHEVLVPQEDRKPRKYLGLSALGEECTRKVWYQFRHVAQREFSGRMLRLFRRGHREEYVFAYLLRGIGFTLHLVDEDGNQFGVDDFEGHLSGHMDGVGEAPLKFWKPKTKPGPFVTEFKTYSDKRFVKVTGDGVRKADPKYYGQMIGYMGYEKLDGGLFCAVNKNDDDLYFEWVPFNQKAFNGLVDKAGEIIEASTPPKRISDNASWYACKYCDFYQICHKGAPAVKSCRSCKFSQPAPDKTWICNKGRVFGEVCKLYQDITK
jgi:hypothetical protein